MYIVCVYFYKGALSVTDSDDDYCVSYTVTMVDVRTCTRSPRSPGPDHHPSMCKYINIDMYVSRYKRLHTTYD